MIPKGCGRPAGIFSQNLGLKNPKKIGKNPNFLRDFPRFSRGLSQKPVNSRTNGWEPHLETSVSAPSRPTHPPPRTARHGWSSQRLSFRAVRTRGYAGKPYAATRVALRPSVDFHKCPTILKQKSKTSNGSQPFVREFIGFWLSPRENKENPRDCFDFF